MKTIFFEVPELEQPIFKQIFGDKEAQFFTEKLNEDTIHLAKEADVVSVFINSVLNQSIIDELPNLKMITTRSTGFDHIDVAYAKDKGITVSNVPAYGSYTVAEFAFALLLNLSRKVHKANEQIRETADFSFLGLRGFDLHGKTLGVIGTGRIGKNVINIGLGFGMKVVAFDLYPDQALATQKGFEYKTLEEVLSSADVITLHAPYTKENHHLLNKEKFSFVKKGAYLINTARGELVDTDALVVALSDGTLAGAGLDVLEGERELKEEIEILSNPQKRDHVKDYKTLFEGRVLMDLPNVIVTPHLAFYSKEAEEEIIKTTVENINNFTIGTPTNCVVPKK